MKAGNGTNTRVELLAMWAILFVAKEYKVENIYIVGDSQVIIDWADRDNNFQSILFDHGNQRFA